MTKELIKRLAIFVDHFKFADDSKRGEAMSLLTELAADQVNTDTVSVPMELYQQIKLIAEEHARDVDDAGGDGCVICKHIFGAAQEGKK